jgi:hypothetical protein
MTHEALATPSGDRVKLHLTISLSRRQAERRTARAIREGKNLEALVAEILEAAPECFADLEHFDLTSALPRTIPRGHEPIRA